MLTPQEIQDKKFEKALLGGYDMSQVDHFLDQVLADYTALFKENATLKSKMRVLVDKIEEYRAVDDQMRKALYNAQITAQEIESRARKEADQMMTAARENAAATIRDLEIEIERENRRLEEAKSLCDAFGKKMQAALAAGSRELETLLTMPSQQIPAEAPETPAPAFEPEPVPEELPEQEGSDGFEEIDVPDFSAKEEEGRFFETEQADEGLTEEKLRMFAPKPRFDFSNLETEKERKDQ